MKLLARAIGFAVCVAGAIACTTLHQDAGAGVLGLGALGLFLTLVD